MSNTRCDLFNWLLVPTAVTVLVSMAVKHAQVERGLTYSLCLLATAAHLHYGTCLVSELRHSSIL